MRQLTSGIALLLVFASCGGPTSPPPSPVASPQAPAAKGPSSISEALVLRGDPAAYANALRWLEAHESGVIASIFASIGGQSGCRSRAFCARTSALVTRTSTLRRFRWTAEIRRPSEGAGCDISCSLHRLLVRHVPAEAAQTLRTSESDKRHTRGTHEDRRFDTGRTTRHALRALAESISTRVKAPDSAARPRPGPASRLAPRSNRT